LIEGVEKLKELGEFVVRQKLEISKGNQKIFNANKLFEKDQNDIKWLEV